MSAHTPGPWHLGGNGFIVYAANGYAVCDVKTFHGRNDSDAANARLIAAAPELLEALDLCTNLLSIWRAWTPDYCTANKDFDSLPEIQRARAALAKARDES